MGRPGAGNYIDEFKCGHEHFLMGSVPLPLEWCRGKNPYRTTACAVLGLGPDAPPRLVRARSEQLAVAIRRGGRKRPRLTYLKTERHGHLEEEEEAIDLVALNAAEQAMTDERRRLHELLLVHRPPAADGLSVLRDRLAAAVPPFPGIRPLVVDRDAFLARLPELSVRELPPPTPAELGLPSVEEDDWAGERYRDR